MKTSREMDPFCDGERLHGLHVTETLRPCAHRILAKRFRAVQTGSDPVAIQVVDPPSAGSYCTAIGVIMRRAGRGVRMNKNALWIWVFSAALAALGCGDAKPASKY